MTWKQIKTGKKVPYIDLRGCQGDLSTYQNEIERVCDSARQRCSEHSEEYEELTMEEKLLVDADIEYLTNEEYLKGGNGLLFMTGVDKYILEKYLARLRKRDRKNDKRN